MKCKEICALLSDYLDGELNEEIQGDVDEHLSTCDDCARELEQLERSLKILKRLKEKKQPHNFLQF